jgi:hypothetical protein
MYNGKSAVLVMRSENGEFGIVRAGISRTPKTKDQIYFWPILEALEKLGGSASPGEVLPRVHRALKHLLTPKDFDLVASKVEAVWENRARWARDHMVKRKLLRQDSPYGLWELAERGMRLLAALREPCMVLEIPTREDGAFYVRPLSFYSDETV